MAYGRSTLYLIANEYLDRRLLNSVVTSSVRGPTLKSFKIRIFAILLYLPRTMMWAGRVAHVGQINTY
jgi:hypothetical protein